MGLRAGANKATAKRQPFSDFKKKTAKVGRKVKSSNVTKIEVTSKRIQIPLQSQITAIKPENEQENLGLLLKTLQHYSGPARTTALEDLKDLLATSPSTESYLSLIFPPALELLFDDERDTRKALISLLTALLTRFPSQSFLSIVPVTITYICSGLTSLNKGVRRDALSLLLAIANLHSHILIPHLEKLVSHVLALLIDPGQAGGQDSLGTTSTTTFASTGGAVSKAKLDESWKKSSAASRKVGGDMKPSANSRPPLLVAVLEVIDALLTSASGILEPSTVPAKNMSADSMMSLTVSNESHFKQAIILRPIRRSSLIYKAGKLTVKKLCDTAAEDDSGSMLSVTLITTLCHRLKSIWRGLVLDSSVVAAHTVDVLILVARVSYRLGGAFHCLMQQEFQSMVTTMFFKFPHSSLEASLSAPGSSKERSSNLKISTMDLYLCDIALLFCGNESIDDIIEIKVDTTEMMEMNSKVNIYLMQKLQLYVDETKNQLITRNNFSTAGMKDSDKMEIDCEDFDGNHTDGAGVKDSATNDDEKELQTFTTSFSNISVRLFHALEVVTLAAGRKESICNTEVVRSGYESEWSMSSLLIMLRQLMEAFVSASTSNTTFSILTEKDTPEGPKFSRRSLLAAVEPILKCLFRLASDTSLWSRGYSQNSFSPLAEALAVISTLIQTADSTGTTAASSSSSSFSSSGPVSDFRTELSELGESYAYALLSIVRRVTPSTSELNNQENTAMNVLSRSIKALFEIPRTSTGLSSPSVKALRSVPFYQYSNTKTKFLLLDVFAHTPFTDLVAATKSVFSTLSSSSVSAEEQKYFLRIAFERRSEMGAAEFIDLLFQSLRTNISARCHGLESLNTGHDVSLSTTATKRTMDLCGRWIVYDIADVVVWCSSADAPERILSFVESFLLNLSASALEGLNERQIIESSTNNGISKGKKGWMNRYASSMATIAMCSRLLAPMLDGLNTDSAIVCNIISLLSQMCLSVLSLSGSLLKDVSETKLIQHSLKGQGQEMKKTKTISVPLNGKQLIGTVINALCLRKSSSVQIKVLNVPDSVSVSDSNMGENKVDEEIVQSSDHSYFVLKSFLNILKSRWNDLSVQQCSNIEDALMVISKITNAEEAVTMRIVCSEDFDSALSFMLLNKRS